MTDSRVTREAVEAAERALVASTSPWPITDELWEKVKRTLGPNGTSSRRQIEMFLTAAAPVLCAPLVAEIESLRRDNARLLQSWDAQIAGDLAARRTLCALSDQYKAERDEALAYLEQVGYS